MTIEDASSNDEVGATAYKTHPTNGSWMSLAFVSCSTRVVRSSPTHIDWTAHSVFFAHKWYPDRVILPVSSDLLVRYSWQT